MATQQKGKDSRMHGRKEEDIRKLAARLEELAGKSRNYQRREYLLYEALDRYEYIDDEESIERVRKALGIPEESSRYRK